MFGRKIPDKVMAPTGLPAGTGGQLGEKTSVSDRTPTPPRADAVLRRAGSGTVETVIGEDTTIVGGKIVSKGTLRIDGRVEGEVQAEEAVVVGPTGTVKANIAARSVAISGKVFGNIFAHDRLEIQPTGEVHGDVQMAAGALTIENGAKLEGKCLMGLDDKGRESAAPQPASVERRVPVEAIPRNDASQLRKQ
jgi:cytoskeletal protein CcmA (bactofilin family)